LFQTVRMTMQAKEDVDQRNGGLQASRAAMSLLERDLRAAYLSLPEDLGWRPVQPSQDDKDPIPAAVKPAMVTIFHSSGNDVFFSARTHQRLSVDSPEDEEHFVTYQLDNDSLVRAESTRAVNLYDREDPDRFKQFQVLSGVKLFKLSFWNEKNERWDDKWDSESAEQKDKLPTAIKVDLEYMPEEIENARRKAELVKLSMIVRPIEAGLKNNPDPAGAILPPGGAPANPGKPGDT